MPNGKASVVAPKLSDDNHVELEEINPSGHDLSPEDDIMQLARMGDIQGIEKLYDSGKFDASYSDAEGITPLHVLWPAILLGGGLTDPIYSGPQSIIGMRCANFS
jgi:palmitoyltransferase ZDHHC13/17